jgi:pilus assembly protein Flp/PilA
MRLLARLMLDGVAASAAEYAIILAIIGGALAISALALSGSISNSMARSSNTIHNCGGGC